MFSYNMTASMTNIIIIFFALEMLSNTKIVFQE